MALAEERPQSTQPEPAPIAGSQNRPSTPVSRSEPVHIAAELRDLREEESKSRILIVFGAALAIIAILIAVISFITRPKPKASGTIEEAYAVALPGDNVLATVRVSYNNIGGKPLWIREIRAQLTTADGKQYTDVAANAVDFDRYFRGYPDLRDHSIQPLKVEAKVVPGEQLRGSAIVSFPVTLDAFNHRKALSILVYPYASVSSPEGNDAAPLIINRKSGE